MHKIKRSVGKSSNCPPLSFFLISNCIPLHHIPKSSSILQQLLLKITIKFFRPLSLSHNISPDVMFFSSPA